MNILERKHVPHSNYNYYLTLLYSICGLNDFDSFSDDFFYCK
jgi:hypothetical protein